MEELRVPLAALRRGPVTRSLTIEDPAAALGGLPLALGPMGVELEVRSDGRGGARARGRMRAAAEVECRRCLTPVSLELEVELDALFRPPAEVEPGEERVWPIVPEAAEIDLAEPLREEVWVQAPQYVLCGPECAGLCPRCGARLADEPCTCEPPEPDRRWEALRALTTGPDDADRG